jgi:ribosome-associated protein
MREEVRKLVVKHDERIGDNMQQIKLREEYIKLGQAIKAAGMVDSGVEAKNVILDGKVKVNGEVEYRRGRKLYNGDLVAYEMEQIQIVE